MQQGQEISLSSRFRYQKVHRANQLQSFLHFKRQFQNYFSPARVANIRKVYSHGICGRNQHRHIVVVDRIGNLKVQDLGKAFEEDQLVSYINQRMIELSETKLEERDQVVWIVDLGGRIMQLASKKILDQISKIIDNLQKYFPEMLYRLVFVNTPMLFDTIWNKLTPHLSQSTQQKVVMIGEQLENVYQFAEPSILPEFLGGEIDDQQFISGQFSEKVAKEEKQSSEEEEADFSQLKQALSGLKIGGKSLESVSQTPLNTEADK